MSEAAASRPPGEPASRRQALAWRLLWLSLATGVALADQLTKDWIVDWLVHNEPVELLPVLDFRVLYNTGAAFGFLNDQPGWQRWFFSAFAGVAIAALSFWLLRLPAGSQPLLACALALIAGGALGNLWDRLELGYVVDFISVHWEMHYFPAFNVADSAITVGAGLVLLDMWRSRGAPSP